MFMARKRLSQYAIFHNVGGLTDLAVYYEAGGADTISGLSIPEAGYIIDFLRNEKPIDYDAVTKRFLSGAAEPIGEEE
jgi:hypothetical protein